jgi:S1-C subfamily serine protease
MADAVSALSPSLVRVEARRRLPATGIVWSADGLVVTSNHVVEMDEGIMVGLADGSRHSATLVGRDPHNDIALLRVDASNLTPASLGDNASLRVGHLVLALGRPGEQVQATLGVVSALVAAPQAERREGREKRKRRQWMQRVLVDGYVQTDVVMYPGFSGGPLVSGDGAVHGMNTSGFQSGSSVTVPIATLRSSVQTLLSDGKVRQGYLGVGVQPVRLPDTVAESLEQEVGLLIVSVEKDSPAAGAGLMVGDILVSFHGQALESLDDLLGQLRGELVGKAVEAEIVRGGVRQTVHATVAERS